MIQIIRCVDVCQFMFKNFIYYYLAGYRKAHDGLDADEIEGEEGNGEPIIVENDETKFLKGDFSYVKFFSKKLNVFLKL